MTTLGQPSQSLPTRTERERLRLLDCAVEAARGRSIHPDGVFPANRFPGDTAMAWQNFEGIVKIVPHYCSDPIASINLLSEGSARFGKCEVLPYGTHSDRFCVDFGGTALPEFAPLREAIARAYIQAAERLQVPPQRR